MDPHTLDNLIGRRVVLDTAGPMIYIGNLEAHDSRGYWLRDVDVHDRTDGHSTKEEYVNEARRLEMRGSRRVNRRRAFVERTAILSISAMDDVVSEDEEQAGEDDSETGSWL